MTLTAEVAADRDALGEQTRERLRIAQSCDPDERDRIHEQVVNSHLWLADALARRFRRPSEDIDDLQQVARTGLVQAVRRYDRARAVHRVRGADDHWRPEAPLPRPRLAGPASSHPGAVCADAPAMARLTQRLRTVPSDRELAASLGASSTRSAKRCANQGYRSDSLDAVGPRGSDDGRPDEISQCENRLMLARVWCQLSEERRLLVLRFYEERSQSDIADRIGTSQMQVSRLLARTCGCAPHVGGLEELQEAS